MKDQRPLPLGGKQEPSLGKVFEAKGGMAEAGKRQADKVEALCSEIFRLTGQKVTAEDPILLAALFQSELIVKAGQSAAAVFQEAVAKSVARLAEMVTAEHDQVANLDRAVANAFQHIADGAKQAGEQELVTMQGRFARMASETLDQIRRESARRAPGGTGWRIGAALCCGLAVGLLGGVLLGKGIDARLSNDQVRLLHNGMLLDEAWPKLPSTARTAFGVPPKAPELSADNQHAAKTAKP